MDVVVPNYFQSSKFMRVNRSTWPVSVLKLVSCFPFPLRFRFSIRSLKFKIRSRRSSFSPVMTIFPTSLKIVRETILVAKPISLAIVQC